LQDTLLGLLGYVPGLESHGAYSMNPGTPVFASGMELWIHQCFHTIVTRGLALYFSISNIDKV